MRVRTVPGCAPQNLARRDPRFEADDGSGDHARRPSMTEPSLRRSCLGARWQARPPAQERSTKALGWCQQHGERDHGGRAPGPSRRSPQASSSSSARSCRSSVAAGQRSPRAVLCARKRSQTGAAGRAGTSRELAIEPLERPTHSEDTNFCFRSTLMRSARRASKNRYGQFCCAAEKDRT